MRASLVIQSHETPPFFVNFQPLTPCKTKEDKKRDIKTHKRRKQIKERRGTNSLHKKRRQEEKRTVHQQETNNLHQQEQRKATNPRPKREKAGHLVCCVLPDQIPMTMHTMMIAYKNDASTPYDSASAFFASDIVFT